MKFLEKLSLAIFSTIILILSLVICLLVFGWLKATSIVYLLQSFHQMMKQKNQKVSY